MIVGDGCGKHNQHISLPPSLSHSYETNNGLEYDPHTRGCEGGREEWVVSVKAGNADKHPESKAHFTG